MRLLLACCCLAVILPSHAGFSITGTRVIYHEAEGEATVHLQRVAGEQPVLLQSWLDDGSPDAQPGAQDLPFLVHPAVVRVNAGGAQVIRIVRVGDAVPADREMLLYFNALEVPPAANDAELGGANSLQFAMQARMKFFYRPTGLQASAAEAAELLHFSLYAQGPQWHLRVHNPTPYHITLPNLGVYVAASGTDAAPLAKFKETGVAPMVLPFAHLDVPLGERAPQAGNVSTRAPAELQVRYTVINDQGGIVPRSGQVQSVQ